MKKSDPTIFVTIQFNRPLTKEELTKIRLSPFTVTFGSKKNGYKSASFERICGPEEEYDQPEDPTKAAFISTNYTGSYKDLTKQKLKERNIRKIKKCEVTIQGLSDETLFPAKVTRFGMLTEPTYVPADIVGAIIESERESLSWKIETKRLQITWDTTDDGVLLGYEAKEKLLSQCTCTIQH